MKRIQFWKKMCVYTQIQKSTISQRTPVGSVCLISIHRPNAVEIGLYLAGENLSALGRGRHGSDSQTTMLDSVTINKWYICTAVLI